MDSKISMRISGLHLAASQGSSEPMLSPHAGFESALAPTCLFTDAPPHTCHGEMLQAKEYALIPLIHSIWRRCHAAAACGSTSKQITVKLCPTPGFNQTQSSKMWHSKERGINFSHECVTEVSCAEQLNSIQSAKNI